MPSLKNIFENYIGDYVILTQNSGLDFIFKIKNVSDNEMLCDQFMGGVWYPNLIVPYNDFKYYKILKKVKEDSM